LLTHSLPKWFCLLSFFLQWDEFCAQFRSVLNLLRQISGVWNLEDPCVISGFDMDRVGTVQVGKLA
jgi:hypothetical protein